MFPSQFECIDFTFEGDEVRFRLVNGIGENVQITNFEITNDASSPLSCTAPITPFDWTSGLELDFVFSTCIDGAFIIGERTEAKITIDYFAIDSPSKTPHEIKGKITAAVTP